MENLNDTRQKITGSENKTGYGQSYQSQYRPSSQNPYYRQQQTYAKPSQMPQEHGMNEEKKKDVLSDQSKGILFGLLGGFLLLGAVIFLVLMFIF